MSIILPESNVYRVISGKHKGRTCVVVGIGAQITDLARIIFTDNIRDERDSVKKGQLAVLDVPGWPEVSSLYDIQDHLNELNMFRTTSFAQPRSLKTGDVLATEEAVIENPRAGYNSSTLIHLNESGWVELAPRLPIALQGNKKFKLPIELAKNSRLATGCLIVKRPISLEVNWTNICLDRENCCFEVPSCIPLALA